MKDVFLLYAILLNVVAPLSMWHHSPKGGWDSDIEHKIIIYIWLLFYMLLILLNIKQELAKRNAKQCDQKIDKISPNFWKSGQKMPNTSTLNHIWNPKIPTTSHV